MTCPHCGEDRLVEHDPVTQRGVCLVCAKTWPAPVSLGSGRLLTLVTCAVTMTPAQ
jgi:hypothetical protein